MASPSRNFPTLDWQPQFAHLAVGDKLCFALESKNHTFAHIGDLKDVPVFDMIPKLEVGD